MESWWDTIYDAHYLWWVLFDWKNLFFSKSSNAISFEKNKWGLCSEGFLFLNLIKWVLPGADFSFYAFFFFVWQGLNERTHNLTLLDGEMVIDTLPTKKFARRYLIYDLMVLNGQPVIEVRNEITSHFCNILLTSITKLLGSSCISDYFTCSHYV